MGLREELDRARRTRFQADNMIVVPEDRAIRAEQRAAAAEAEVRRLTEEAQRGQEPLAHLILDATTIRQAHKIARAALLSASPSDGGGAK